MIIMKFKIDENLPVELAEFLRNEGYDAITVIEQNLYWKKIESEFGHNLTYRIFYNLLELLFFLRLSVFVNHMI